MSCQFTMTGRGHSTKSTPPPFSCGGPALWSGWPGGSALTSAVSVSAPPPPSPSDSSGSTSGKAQEERRVKKRREKCIQGQKHKWNSNALNLSGRVQWLFFQVIQVSGCVKKEWIRVDEGRVEKCYKVTFSMSACSMLQSFLDCWISCVSLVLVWFSCWSKAWWELCSWANSYTKYINNRYKTVWLKCFKIAFYLECLIKTGLMMAWLQVVAPFDCPSLGPWVSVPGLVCSSQRCAVDSSSPPRLVSASAQLMNTENNKQNLCQLSTRFLQFLPIFPTINYVIKQKYKKNNT